MFAMSGWYREYWGAVGAAREASTKRRILEEENASLRLTKKERKAIAFAVKHCGAFKNQAATLLGILERHDRLAGRD